MISSVVVVVVRSSSSSSSSIAAVLLLCFCNGLSVLASEVSCSQHYLDYVDDHEDDGGAAGHQLTVRLVVSAVMTSSQPCACKRFSDVCLLLSNVFLAGFLL